MATNIKSTALDFDNIKESLKTFLKSKSEFTDYDFDASGLDNILDVLAYNTHFNGLVSNFSLNESFLNTSQLRSSIVSHAEALGYVPRSYSSSTVQLAASVNVTATSRPSSLVLPRNTKFTTSVDGVSYVFQTREAFTGEDNGTGIFNFTTNEALATIPVFEGTEKTKTFFVGEADDSQIYVIPDLTMDTNTIRVRVFDTISGTTFNEFTNIKDAIQITDTTRFYQIKEVPNGYYELIFGDGKSTGIVPVSGNKIVVDYLSTAGPDANGATVFTANSKITVDGIAYDLLATTSTPSAGGAFKESIESIRQNAPIAFASQRRMVTAEDYKAQINSKFGEFLDDLIAYGGADNEPPIYGRVFVGLKFKDSITSETQQSVKDSIKTTLTDNLAVMSIDTEFVEPQTTFLELTTIFNLDPDLTSQTTGAVESTVESTINNFFNTNLKKFNKVFRRSNLVTLIDAIDPAILNSRISVKMQQRFTPTLNTRLQYTIKFPAIIGNADDINRTVTSSKFVVNNKTCTLQNVLNSTKLQIVTEDGDVEVDNAGSFDSLAGTVSLTGFNPSSFQGSSIKISVTPGNESTIRPLRNFILDKDDSLSVTRAILDFQNTAASL